MDETELKCVVGGAKGLVARLSSNVWWVGLRA